MIGGFFLIATPSVCENEEGFYDPGTISCANVQCFEVCSPEEITADVCETGACCVNGECRIVEERVCQILLRGQFNGFGT